MTNSQPTRQPKTKNVGQTSPAHEILCGQAHHLGRQRGQAIRSDQLPMSPAE